MTKAEEKRIRKLWNTYKRCAKGQPANCDKCIGCCVLSVPKAYQ